MNSNENDNTHFWPSPRVTINFPNLRYGTQLNSLSVSGTTVGLSMRVINDGGSSAVGFSIAYYLSLNSTISITDYKIGEDNISILAPNSYKDELLVVDVSTVTPSISTGTYYVGYFIDYQNSVRESDETDNLYAWSSPQVTITSSNSPPNKPQLLTPGNGTSWSAPFNLTWQCTDPDPGDILNYTVRSRRKGITTWNSISVGTQTTYTISGWSASDLGTYEWSVVASDGEAQTTSDIWEFILVAENHPPNKPQLLTPGNGTSWSAPFNLTWQCTDPDAGDILNYTVRSRRKGITTWNSVSVGTQTTYTISGWSASDLGTYEWSVVASDGEAQTTSDIWEFILVAENHPPNKPQLLTPGNGTSWSAPFNLTWQCTDPDEGDVLNYTLRIRLKGTSTWNTNSLGTQTSYTLSGWSGSDLGTYEWSVVASDGEAQTISDIWEFILVAENHPPNKPQLLTPGNGTSWSAPFNLTWQCTDPDAGDVLNYTLRIRLKGTSTWNTNSLGTQTSYTLSGWSGSDLGTYEWSVVASDGEAQTISDIWEFILVAENHPPNKPQLLTPGNGTSWSAPFNLTWQCTDPDAGDVLNYTLRIRLKGTSTWNTNSLGTQTSYTLSGWSGSDLGTYEWSVVASDGEAQTISDIWEFILVAENHPPNKPQLLTPGNGTSWPAPFNLTWQCTDPDAGDVLNYTLRIRLKGTSTWNTNSLGTQTSYTLSGWSGSDLGTYEWSVVASDGEAQTISDIWEFILVAENHPPNKPQLLTPGNGTSWSAPFNLTWQCTDPDAGDVLNYTLRIRLKGTSTWNTNSLGTQTSYTLSGWSGSDLGTYEWSVVASDGEAQTISDIWEFTLEAPAITVTSPNGGEIWSVGSNQNITWTSSGTSGNVRIEYSTNNGSSWTDIIASTLDDGSYSWTIPNTPSTSCLVRISDTDGNPTDQSNDGLYNCCSSVTGISVQPTTMNLYAEGATGTIVATVAPNQCNQ